MGTHVDQQAGPIVHTICRGGWENLGVDHACADEKGGPQHAVVVVGSSALAHTAQQGLQMVTAAHNIYLSATLLFIVGSEDLVEAALRGTRRRPS